jgi:hypothetical protein
MQQHMPKAHARSIISGCSPAYLYRPARQSPYTSQPNPKDTSTSSCCTPLASCCPVTWCTSCCCCCRACYAFKPLRLLLLRARLLPATTGSTRSHTNTSQAVSSISGSTSEVLMERTTCDAADVCWTHALDPMWLCPRQQTAQKPTGVWAADSLGESACHNPEPEPHSTCSPYCLFPEIDSAATHKGARR